MVIFNRSEPDTEYLQFRDNRDGAGKRILSVLLNQARAGYKMYVLYPAGAGSENLDPVLFSILQDYTAPVRH